MVEIGIMQGRLLPPVDGRFQAFPADRWRDEFALAKRAGLARIEWIFEKPNADLNPLGDDKGAAEIQKFSRETGVQVRSVCADYYMEERLVGADGAPSAAAVDHLRWLIGRAGRLSIGHIVLPFVDASSLRTAAEIEGLVSVLAGAAPAAAAAAVELHLETDLAPEAFRALLDRVGHPLVRANYDIGNSASLGYDPGRELALLGPQLGSVHVKDRALGGGTVPLGTGNADFPVCFRMFVEAGYGGAYVLQAARGLDGDEVALAVANRRFIEEHLAPLGRARVGG